MGMQIHFNISDLPKEIPRVIHYEPEYGAYTLMVDTYEGEVWAIDTNLGGDCWFDCGASTELQLARIKWLIQNRVCFNAS